MTNKTAVFQRVLQPYSGIILDVKYKVSYACTGFVWCF